LEIDQRRRLSGQTGQPGPHSSSTHTNAYTLAHTHTRFAIFFFPLSARTTARRRASRVSPSARACARARLSVCTSIRVYVTLSMCCIAPYAYDCARSIRPIKIIDVVFSMPEINIIYRRYSVYSGAKQ